MNNNSTNDDDQFHQQQQETIMSFPGNSNKINHLYKILVVGDYAVGKTSLIRRYCSGEFSSNYRITIGVDFCVKNLEWDSSTNISLQLWDIAGHERFGAMTRVYYKFAIAAVVCFDISRPSTLDNVRKWSQDINDKVVLPNGHPIPMLLLANKCDIPDITIDRAKMTKFAQENGFIGWFETSSKNNFNINSSFEFLVTHIMKLTQNMKAQLEQQQQQLQMNSSNQLNVVGTDSSKKPSSSTSPRANNQSSSSSSTVNNTTSRYFGNCCGGTASHLFRSLQSKNFNVVSATMMNRNYATIEQQMEKENSGKAKFIRQLIQDILTKPENEKANSREIKLLSALLSSKEDFEEVLNTATKIGAFLDYNGYHEVGNNLKKDPVVVAVTGAAGQIGYSLLPRIASGEMLGYDQPVILQLIEVPDALKALEGVVMELQDCAFPLLRGVKVTSDLKEGFAKADFALLVGAKPRGKGMERADLLKDNAKIFQETGKAIDAVANKNCLTLVVGNPANTNALVASANAPNIDPTQFSAMTRLDHDRALAQLSLKTKVPVTDIKKVTIWGNHSATQFPDVTYASINGKSAKEVIGDDKWIESTFIPTVQKRGAAIIDARGASSAASAADAAIKHVRDWQLGSNGEWVSMAVWTDGSYNVPKGLYSSFPVVCQGNGKYEIVKDLKVEKAQQDKINVSVKELQEEKSAVSSLMKK